jgi:hypothetical protein
MPLTSVIEQLQKESRLVGLGDEASSNFFLKVYPNGHFENGELDWEQLPVPDNSSNSLFIGGILAQSIYNFLQLQRYDLLQTKRTGVKTFAKYFNDPDCHGAAMYVMGIIDYLKRIIPIVEFKEIYQKKPAVFTYEPQAPPVLVHLLNSKLEPKDIPEFTDWSTPHSVVLLGELDGQPVCFEKRGNLKSRFSTLQAAEEIYRTKYRLYVVQR